MTIGAISESPSSSPDLDARFVGRTGSLLKRGLDFFGALVGLIVLLPVIAVVSFLIVVTDGRPIFFVQERVGFDGRSFNLFKFRSMRQSKGGAEITVAGDNRITGIGRWLRKLKLDEFPQLWNVLIGEMSLVGPRPEVPSYVALYTPEQRRVLLLKPGITDPASLRYFDENAVLAKAADPHKEYVENLMPEKIRINMEYAERAGLASDLVIICKTLCKVFRG